MDVKKEKLCRACLQQSNEEMYSLMYHSVPICYDNLESIETSLADIYLRCTQINYEHEHSKYQWICEICYQKMIDFNEFQQMCIKSADFLDKISTDDKSNEKQVFDDVVMDEDSDTTEIDCDDDHSIQSNQSDFEAKVNLIDSPSSSSSEKTEVK